MMHTASSKTQLACMIHCQTFRKLFYSCFFPPKQFIFESNSVHGKSVNVTDVSSSCFPPKHSRVLILPSDLLLILRIWKIPSFRKHHLNKNRKTTSQEQNLSSQKSHQTLQVSEIFYFIFIFFFFEGRWMESGRIYCFQISVSHFTLELLQANPENLARLYFQLYISK